MIFPSPPGLSRGKIKQNNDSNHFFTAFSFSLLFKSLFLLSASPIPFSLAGLIRMLPSSSEISSCPDDKQVNILITGHKNRNVHGMHVNRHSESASLKPLTKRFRIQTTPRNATTLKDEIATLKSYSGHCFFPHFGVLPYLRRQSLSFTWTSTHMSFCSFKT